MTRRKRQPTDTVPRYPKSIAYTAQEWPAVAAMLVTLEEPSYSALTRRAMRELADRHGISWPTSAVRSADQPTDED